MRMFVGGIILTMISFGSMGLCENVSPPEREMALSEIDVRIKDVKRQIQIYQNRAFFTDREAQRLLTLDYFAYRHYLLERDRDLNTVDALKQELAVLEKQRAAMAENRKDENSSSLLHLNYRI